MTGWDSRAAAGLVPPRAISTQINPTRGVTGHYGGAGPFRRSDHAGCRAIWRAWQAFHMSPGNTNNYNDIAYSLGVCWHDVILEGRSTRSRPIVRGGANGNAQVNFDRYSVVAIWGANDGAWPDGLRRAWRSARDWLREQDGRTGAGLDPHSALSSTSCPGGPGRAFLAAGAPYPGGSTNPPPGSNTPEDDMPYRQWPQADKDALVKDVAEAVRGVSLTSRVSGNASTLGAQVAWSHDRADTAAVRAIPVSRIETKVDTLLARAEGLDESAILRRMDEHAAAAAEERSFIADLVAQVGAGKLAADAAIELVERRMAAAGDALGGGS